MITKPLCNCIVETIYMSYQLKIHTLIPNMAANLKIVQDVMIIIIKINGNVIKYFVILVYF